MFSNTLEGNILKYNLYKTFTKRVFLPLIAVYLTTIGNVTLTQLGIIASITAVVSLFMEVPTGYFADKMGHKKSLLLGSFITAISPLFYVIMPNFIGGILGSVLFFAGSSFTQGAIQVFIHETLIGLKRDQDYVKIMGKGQSYGLVGNTILLAIIPLTYSIHPSLPFIAGFICLFIAFLLVLSFKEPDVHLKSNEDNNVSFFHEVKNSFSRKLIYSMALIFLIFGIATATFNSSTIYREIVFTNFKIPVSYFGFILAFGSLLAALTGNYIHHLKKLKAITFYIFDVLYIVITLMLISFAKSPILVILAFSLIPIYSRTRAIIFESVIFEEFPKSNYKATLISIMNFFYLGSAIGIPLIFAFTVSKYGIMKGHFIFGLIIITILLPIFLMLYLVKRNNPNKKVS
ncbi:MAG: MFS transporter [Candidatus Paceibacterota bacterium]